MAAHGIPRPFIEHELTQMNKIKYAKTSNRSVVGIMNQFSYLVEGCREHLETNDWTSPVLVRSLRPSKAPCTPLYRVGLFRRIVS